MKHHLMWNTMNTNLIIKQSNVWYTGVCVCFLWAYEAQYIALLFILLCHNKFKCLLLIFFFVFESTNFSLFFTSRKFAWLFIDSWMNEKRMKNKNSEQLFSVFSSIFRHAESCIQSLLDNVNQNTSVHTTAADTQSFQHNINKLWCLKLWLFLNFNCRLLCSFYQFNLLCSSFLFAWFISTSRLWFKNFNFLKIEEKNIKSEETYNHSLTTWQKERKIRRRKVMKRKFKMK